MTDGHTTLIVSVGGKAEPIIHTIRETRPAQVIFFASQGSRRQVFEEVIPQLDLGYCPEHHLVIADDEQDLGRCVFKLLQEVPARMRDLGGAAHWPDVVGYTGGTKTMSAALVWASARRDCRFCYVGSRDASGRENNGLGTVRTGAEHLVQIQNPWNRVAHFEVLTAIELFNRAQYRGAETLLREVRVRVDDPHAYHLIETLENVFGAFGDWDAFHHGAAFGRIKKRRHDLRELARSEDALLPGLKSFAAAVERESERVRQLADARKNDRICREMILDLLANALRRAGIEHRYEDAVARCYAAVEKFAQLQLREAHGIIANHVDPSLIPQTLRDEFMQRYQQASRWENEEGEPRLKIPLFAAYRLLQSLGDPLGTRFMLRSEFVDKHLAARNDSILAHGVRAMGKEDFNSFWKDALHIMDIDAQVLPLFPRFLAS